MWKEYDLIMLPVEGEKPMSHQGIIEQGDSLLYFHQSIYISKNVPRIGQHLYVLSNEKINVGDWYLTFEGAGFHSVVGVPRKCEDSNYSFSYCKKIIATTDSSLKYSSWEPYHEHPQASLPQPNQSFLETFVSEFNRKNVIKKVMVKYTEDLAPSGDFFNPDIITVLKINQDNTINIKKTKDSWTRNEILVKGYDFLRWLALDHNHEFNTYEDAWNYWTEENL